MVIIPTEKRFDWKHTPVTLIILVLLNVFIFFLYQSGDEEKYETAFIQYKQQGFFNYEWPLFEKYLSRNKEAELLRQYQRLHHLRRYDELSYYLLIRSDFYEYLKRRADYLIDAKVAERWFRYRAEINETIHSTSILANGLNPGYFEVHTLLTHQFLHGGLMHLVGNLFFLIICGFAVEAAIGHFRFLFFYLVSGLAGGLLHMLMNTDSSSPLVGASGAISGVMAMYLGVFRFKKIEFFYWFFIFVGYFRAPALLILPFYIGQETYNYYSNDGSNVAFMAHAGGFLAGSLLMVVSLLIKPDMLNEAYVEEEQGADPKQEKLAKVYDYIEKFRFNAAFKVLAEVIRVYGRNFELTLLQYNLLKINQGKNYQQCVCELLSMERVSAGELIKIEKIWLENQSRQKNLGNDKLLKLGWRFTGLADLSTAEDIFEKLNQSKSKPQSLGSFARKLSVVFEQKNDRKKKRYYEAIADELI